MKKPNVERKSIVSVTDLTVRFGDTTIIDGLSLDVNRGEILGIVGGSGSG
ncbi:MAG: ABC transporter ATP-binding protein, partial [Hyphomicrobiales bacterium]|nr:ABC transporter ATP-binding protein [Hyphomicrobiales bacterium]